MKNVWLRAEEQIATEARGQEGGHFRELAPYSRPGSGSLRHLAPRLGGQHVQKVHEPDVLSPAIQRRPKTAPMSATATSLIVEDFHLVERIKTRKKIFKSTKKKSNAQFSVNCEIHTSRQLEHAKKLLEGVTRRDCTSSSRDVPQPMSHIGRQIEMEENPTIKRCDTPKHYDYITKDFITFGTFDVHLRSDWDQRFVASDVQALEDRNKRVTALKQKLVELNAITSAVKEVMSVYSQGENYFIEDNMTFPTPIYLNNHEIHAWRTTMNLLYNISRSISLNHLKSLAVLCGLGGEGEEGERRGGDRSEEVRSRHPEVYHFVCYLNLLLGGTKSFASAKFMLLRDLSMLLRLIQQINPLNIPLENLRSATAFRIREARLMTKSIMPSLDQPSLAHQSSFASSKFSNSKNNNHKSVSSSHKPPPPWNDSTFHPSSLESKGTRSRPECSEGGGGVSLQESATDTVRAKNSSVFKSLPKKLSSFILAFSIISRIALVSAERSPPQELMDAMRTKKNVVGDMLLIKTEEVRINKETIIKLIAEKHASCTKLPPPAPVLPGPNYTPTGLFATQNNHTTADRTQWRRRSTLNQSIKLQMKSTKEIYRRESINLKQQQDVLLSRIHSANNNSGTKLNKFFSADEASHNSSVSTAASSVKSTAKKMAKRLTTLKTGNVCVNFRNAQRLLVPLIHKHHKDGGGTSALPGIQDEMFEFDSSEEDSGDGGEDDLFAEYEEDDDDDESDFNFFDLNAKAHGDRTPSAPSTGVSVSHLEKLHSINDKERKHFYLYADMMTEAESIKVLHGSNESVRAGVLDSLTSKRDIQINQNKWQMSKTEEKKVYKANIEKNKEYIDEVVRMQNLRAQLPASENQDTYSIRWMEVYEKNKKGLQESVAGQITAADKVLLKRMLFAKRSE